ncbi:uncharacterized protein RSE6_07305 [Rhynchosporium secalis]|uniref:Uncharacterized protein n=1 Tax=Rhynchosporium secalis TaxID=38038 RepID=A0A1E1MCH5_RHYSE|nr:uncharacterized protein RSE6_07305 [Rhynchosporium secalis]
MDEQPSIKSSQNVEAEEALAKFSAIDDESENLVHRDYQQLIVLERQKCGRLE